ncbi:unnamed protein product [Arabidopsis halleri]
MTTMSDLSMDLLGEILSRVPLTSLSAVRCTCKSWNALSKHQIFGKAEVAARKQFLGNQFGPSDMFTLGYDNNNRNHKIMRFRGYNYTTRRYLEIHDINSNSWRVVEFNPIWCLGSNYVSLKGNTYFFAQDITEEEEEDVYENYIVCFDFTAERFGPQLPLPFQSYDDDDGDVTLSCVREEQLALLYQSWEPSQSIEIWITNKIDPNLVSWSKFLKLDITQLTRFPKDFRSGRFFIDEEKKVALVSDSYKYIAPIKTCRYYKAYLIGEDGYYKPVKIQGSKPPDFSSYTPSLVQLQTNKPCKRKRRNNKPKGERKNKRRMIEITN